MRLDNERDSDNIEDRRGMRSSGKLAGGTIGTLILALVAMYFGVDPRVVLDSAPRSGISQNAPAGPLDRSDPDVKLVSRTLASTEDVWTALFSAAGKSYVAPKLVLFTDRVASGCGQASAASGPFYCPGDSKVYIDLGFYRELALRFQAPGDFAQAYVIAHEVGHHVQNLLGISGSVHRRQQAAASSVQANALSVRLELRADCLAGVWAYHANRTRHILEAGDVEEGLTAASAIGDDRLQKEARGYIVPDSFTHGSSAQRVRWFSIGFQRGHLGECDTFSAKSL